MKYMGSKRSMLANGLGQILSAEAAESKRFADLFVGSGIVAWHVAQTTNCRVLAGDLQSFAVVLAESVIARRTAIDPESVWSEWHQKARRSFRRSRLAQQVETFEDTRWEKARRASVTAAREICADAIGPVTRAYGGYYFSPKQALTFDALRRTVPTDPVKRSVALAALIWGASECAAAPGHTAQPFRPTKKGARFLFEAWRRDAFVRVKSALRVICPLHAQAQGSGIVGDAESLARKLRKGDLAFIDPPYSGVHYSRFYHVLETIARGSCGDIEGAGRYPAPSERPRSDFSMKSKSEAALDRLLSSLSQRGVRAILTFPKEHTSNGLSGFAVETIAKKYFKSSKRVVNGRFSTLGGNLRNRKARVPAYEIILSLAPKN